MPRIYIVEDDPNIQQLIAATLRAGGFEAELFNNGAELFETLKSGRPDVLILDIMLPGDSGLDILKKIRTIGTYASLPIILLTAKSEEMDKVTGLEMGADDYITKPFGVLELISRVKLALRHATGTSVAAAKEEAIHYKDIEFNHASKELIKDGKPLALTYMEYELFFMLLINKGIVVSREKLLSSIWGYEYQGGTRTVDVHINSLRQKLGDPADAPRYIATVRGHGYKLLKEE